MRDTQLIFVEGLTGSGKSTTAQWLCHLLEANRVPVTWYHELDMDHPVCNYGDAERASRSAAACEAFHAESRARWRAFAETVGRERRVHLFDGSLLQVPLYSLQTAMCGDDVVTRHVREVEQIVAPLEPVVVFLRYADTGAAFERICSVRPGFEEYVLGHVRTTPYGRAHGVSDRSDLVALLDAQAALAHSLLGASRLATREIEIDEARWDDYRSDIAAFLSLAGDGRQPAVDLTGLPGRYMDADSKLEMVIEADAAGLFIQGSGTRLLARAADTFDIEGISVELTFERHAGRAARILCAARVTDFGRVWVRQE